MISRLLSITVWSVALVTPVSLLAQRDAQDVTQSIFDTHKSQDPTNSERALTDKNKVTAHIAEVPLPKQIHDLEVQKQNFLQRWRADEEKRHPRTVDREIAQRAENAWKGTDPGKLLERLKIEQTNRKKVEARASEVALPKH